MSIEVACPNGHTLKVKDSLAGKTGLCPVCKARVRIPRAAPSELTEDAILGIIGPYEPDESILQQPIEEPTAAKKREASAKPTNTTCEKCSQQVPAGATICPYCRTYLFKMSDLTKNL